MFRFSIRGGGELHRLEQADFSFWQEGKCKKFVSYHKRTSKNGKATMTKFQPEPFRPALKIYKPNVVDTFERYYFHLPIGMKEFFLLVIDNPRSVAWDSRGTMRERTLTLLVKHICQENGLDPDEFTNKSGRTTLATRMGEAGVPPKEGMLVTGHNSKKAYAKYDRSKEAKVKAAQRCAIEESFTYVQALEEETKNLKLTKIEGVSDESPAKRLKSNDEDDVGCIKNSIAMKLQNLQIDNVSPLPSASEPGLIARI